jgi:hypothetical protein
MSGEESLRRELEAVYNAHIEALKKKDFEAFIATVYGAMEMGPVDEMRAQFAEMTEAFLETTPDLSQTTFVAVKTEGDDLAGYYYIFKDPNFVNVFLCPFLKVSGRWRLVLSSSSFSFQPKKGEDIVAKAKQLVETERGLQLERPAEPEGPSASRAWNEDVRAALDCMAYGYQVKIAVNGAPLDIKGGCSYSGSLVGFAPGDEPAAPAVLQVGKNQITVEWNKAAGQQGPELTVQVRVLPDRLAFSLATIKRQSGKVTAEFTVPATETDEIPVVEINADET